MQKTKDREILAKKIVRGVNRIPLSWRRIFFVGLWYAFYYVSRRHRFITLYNLTRAFPDKSINEVKKIAKGVYRNLGIVTAEMFDLPYLTEKQLKHLITVEGMENIDQARVKQKGFLLFGAHFSNWELMAHCAPRFLGPLTAVYRPLDHPLLDSIVRYIRSGSGNILVPKQRAMIQMFRSLGQGGAVALFIDQNMALKDGVFVEFFGRSACTTDGLALMAFRSEAPVLPCFIVRQDDGSYRLIIGEEVEIIRTDDMDRDVKVNTQRFTTIIENMIRQYPDQWLWIHQRWKTVLNQIRE
ncbi:MAG: lysophospholipid acyltransferase family protein [Syntrophobacterales bacterium]|jgi:KDO2-lipid IV(A) lauroyltransferase|nr:lysophospholipid acyltransferase family protein [Syntrophobacterales bacterium]